MLVLGALLLAAIAAALVIVLAGLLVILAVVIPVALIYLILRAPLILQALFNWFCELLGLCKSNWLTTVSRIDPLPVGEWSSQLREFRQVDVTGKPGNRPILCCDGGGVRGILTLRILQQLEITLGARCIDIFDMFAGTSTGSIIAACLASGVALDDIIALYQAKYTVMFTPSLIYAIVGGIPGLNQFFIPKYDNSPNKCLLKSIFGDHTLADSKKDIFITAKDTVRSETTYLTAFHDPVSGNVRGTYQAVKTWAAVAASSSSAPTFFRSIGRFIDGGVGSYNNTAYVAAVEALRYSGTPTLYERAEVVVLSFGTGTALNAMKLGQAPQISTSIGWIEWLLDEGMEDANNQQTYVAMNELAFQETAIEFRRFQLNFTDATISELVSFDATLASHPDLTTIGLDAVADFGFLDKLGQAYGKWLATNNYFNPPIAPPADVEIGDPKAMPTYNISVYGPQVISELNSQTAP
jgi:hypothetical protein